MSEPQQRTEEAPVEIAYWQQLESSYKDRPAFPEKKKKKTEPKLRNQEATVNLWVECQYSRAAIAEQPQQMRPEDPET